MDQAELTTVLCELSSEQQQVVRDTLQCILVSPFFSKSKRYPALLEYLVFNALEGNSGALKERSVGIDVFGRPHTYDPGNDPIVRVAAGEVRRRIALYYSEHPDAPVRIDFPLGHYTAEFHFRPPSASESVPEQPQFDVVKPLDEASVEEPVRIGANRARKLVRGGALVALLLLCVGGAAYWRDTHNAARMNFWGPVLRNDAPAMVVVGELAQATDKQRWIPPATTPGAADTSAAGATSMANTITAGQICNIFRGYGRSCDLISAGQASMSNLRDNTVVLIGLDNDWTHRMLMPLRYRFESKTPVTLTPNTEFIIDQSSDANHLTWRLSQNPQTDTDYALVGRFHSDLTDGIAVVAAGLTPNGTLGATQFISSPENMAQLLAQAPKGWKGFNFEAVLEINIVQGSPGHVKVVATQFW